MRVTNSVGRARPLWAASVVALIGAALLVAYLQRRDTAEQHAQTALISQEVCERTAALVANRLRRQFEAAMVETIEGIDHAYLRECRLPRVAPGLAAGLAKHPYVERFFLWNERFPDRYRDQVLFYAPAGESEGADVPITGEDGVGLGGLHADPDLGRDLLRIAHSPQYIRRSLILVEREERGVPYQIVMHTYGAVAWPEDTPGIVGYTVNLASLRSHVLGEMATSELVRAAPSDRAAPRLQLTILDREGRVAYGPPVPDGTTAGRVPVSLAFYPTGMPSRWAGSSLPAEEWTIVVSAVPGSPALDTQDYLFAAVFLLICIALVSAGALHRQATRLSRMHADFVANVTHQLKTPLSLLSAATETMQLDRVRTPEKMREYATLVNNQTVRLTSLVERILRFSRIDAGAGEYEFEPTDLTRLVRGALARLDGTVSCSGVLLTFDAPEEAVPVVADATAIEDVLANLLENAVKYSPDGSGARVAVQVTRTRLHALVAVRDRGIGIEPHDLPHIFDKFYRGRRTGSQVRGFGLGLAIVQRIVRAHRGWIDVESVPGEWTEFRIVLPVAGG